MIGTATYSGSKQSTSIDELKLHAINPDTMSPFCNSKLETLTYTDDDATPENISCNKCKAKI